jgi:serine/threonine protein kinase
MHAGFRMVKRIGASSSAEVWRAEAPGGFEVAVKVYYRPNQDDALERELRALEFLKRLRHVFLVQIQSFVLHEERLYVIMELADADLRMRLEECRVAGLHGIPKPELLGYLREVAEVLDYLHSERLVHRNVKPSSVLLFRGHVKLGDLDSIEYSRREGATDADPVGTPLYMAPEVWGGWYTPQSDQYALALTYVELCLGRPVFTGETALEVMFAHQVVSPVLDPLPPEEQAVLLRALAKEPDERFATCREFVQALEGAVSESGGHA